MTLLINDDIELAKTWRLSWGGDGGHNVEFQFAPTVESDGRSADWKKVSVPWRTPISIFASPSAREMTLKWTYIVDGEWSTTKVANQVSKVKEYFGNTGGFGKEFVIKGGFILHGGEYGGTTFLGTNCSVKHSETIIIPKTGNGKPDYKKAYPLVSEVSMSIETWTKGRPGYGKTRGRVDDIRKEDGEFTQEIDGLKPKISEGWF